VLLINDHDSGAGVILESSRLQGVLKGTSLGELQIADIMSDEKVEAGEHVITSGGDRIFPKGLSVGTVISASPDHDNDPFLSIKVRPSSDLRRLEEVLVITKMAEETPAMASGSTSLRAADILSERLPSIPKPDPNAPKTPGATTPANKLGGAATGPKKESASVAAGAKPATGTTEGASGKNPAVTGKPAGPTTNGQPATPKLGTETKKPAGGTGQTSTTGAGASPTPTPKPKATPAQKTKAATPPNASAGKPEAAAPAATPTPERPPR
jgi:rod shape-determining protein MreC